MTSFPLSATLFLLNPIFTMILTSILLNESVSMTESLAALASFFGAALVAKSGAGGAAAVNTASSNILKSHSAGIVFALLAAMIGAIVFTIIRKMHSRIHFLFSAFSLGAATLLYTTAILRESIFSIVAGLAVRPVAATLVCTQALLVFLGQCFLSESLQHCRGLGTIIRNMEVIFGYMLGVAVFNEVPSPSSFVGATTVLGSVIIIATQKTRKPQRC
jgi:drug/metabolite transporter (DMT)-like permease